MVKPDCAGSQESDVAVKPARAVQVSLKRQHVISDA